MINNVTLVGRLTRDVELRYTNNGKAMAFFTLALDNGKDNDATFIDCQAWDKAGELIGQYVKKGELFGITGRLNSYLKETPNGDKYTRVNVVVEKFKFFPNGNNKKTTENNTQMKEVNSVKEVANEIKDAFNVPF